MEMLRPRAALVVPRLVFALGLSAIGLWAAGCDAPDDTGVSDGGAAADLARTPRDGPSCADADAPDGGTCLRQVEATVVDEAGVPIPKLLVSVCNDQCFFGISGDNGHVVVPIGVVLDPTGYNIVLHGRPDRAGYYAPLPALDGDVARFARPLVLPALPTDGPTLDTEGKTARTVTSGGVTLALPAGVSVLPSVEDVVDATTPLRFRALLLPATVEPAFLAPLAPSDRPDQLYAVTPYESIFEGGGAMLRFANSLGLAPGAAVTVMSLGSLLDATGPPAGSFAPIGTAHVSMDGTTVDVDAPIQFLTWFGLRKKGP